MNAPISRRHLLAGAAATAATAVGAGSAHAEGEPIAPNILLFVADDMDSETPGSYGGRPDVTPTIDGLAGEGVTFHRAHVPIAVCQPSRSALMTGRYPHRNGAEGFEPIRDDVPLLTDVLRDQGYLMGILGKVPHLAPVARFGWDLAVDQPDLGMGRDPARYAQEAAGLFEQAKAQSVPFFLMANSHDPHRPFHGSAQEQRVYSPEQLATIPRPSRTFGPDDVDVPGFLPDLPDVRQELSEYLSSSRRADDVLAAVLAELDAASLSSNTIVIVMSDNGMALPFAKSNCYLQSTRTPLIVRWPCVTQPGRDDTTHFVSTMDLFPTVCRAAGGVTPSGIDGRDLYPLLTRRIQPSRNRIHTVYHETAGRRSFEMRCTQDDRWGYIWNAWSDGETRYQAENMQGLTWPAMTAAAATDPAIAERVDLYLHRVPEELYDLQNDPDSLHNLVPEQGTNPDPKVVAALQRQRAAVRAWMGRTDDPLAARYTLPPLDSFDPVGPPYDTFSVTEALFGQNDESFVIVANGSALWMDADEYAAIYRSDAAGLRVTATTKVIYQENTDAGARAGLMIRNDITQAGSSPGYVVVGVTAGRGFVMNWDSDGNGFLDSSQRVGDTRYPVWLRLVLDGSQVTGFFSADGQTWEPITTVEMASLAETQDIGIFATSINAAETSRADFASFDIQETPG